MNRRQLFGGCHAPGVLGDGSRLPAAFEPHVATAHWNQDGHLTVWTSTQGSFTARQQTAELLQIPISQVKVIPCEIGGGFGGKIAVYLEPVVALLSRKSGRLRG